MNLNIKTFIEKDVPFCWCTICGRKIDKKEKRIRITKGAWRGQTRINICSDCMIIGSIYLSSEISKERLDNYNKEILLENLK